MRKCLKKKRNIKIAVFDTGIDLSHDVFKNKKIYGKEYRWHNGKVICSANFGDIVGHGAAVAGIIIKKLSNCTLLIYKVLNEKLEGNIECIIEALKDAAGANVDIVNLSFGTVFSSADVERLKQICEWLKSQNIIIVAASGNYKKISYPATFDNTLAVYGGKISNSYKFYFKKDKIIAKGDRQKCAWLNNTYKWIEGSSFATAHITGIIALMLQNYGRIDFPGLNVLLAEHSLSVAPQLIQDNKNARILKKPYKIKQIQLKRDIDFIKKAVLFSSNSSFSFCIRFKELLPFKIIEAVDVENINSDIKTKNKLIVLEEERLSLTNKFRGILKNCDTIVLDYCNELIETLGKENFKTILNYAFSLRIKVYSILPLEGIFDNGYVNELRETGGQIYDPYYLDPTLFEKINKFLNNTIVSNNYHKTPIIGIFGVSFNQSIFSCQLIIRKLLMDSSLKIIQLGMDSYSELFNFDYTLSGLYATNRLISSDIKLHFMQGILRIMDEKSCDVILAGGYKGLFKSHLDGSFDNIPSFTWSELIFLLGIKPDAYILAVSDVDSKEHIQNTINMVKTLCNSKLLAMIYDKQIIGRRDIDNTFNHKVLIKQFRYYEKEFGVKCFDAQSKTESGKIVNSIKDFIGNYHLERKGL